MFNKERYSLMAIAAIILIAGSNAFAGVSHTCNFSQSNLNIEAAIEPTDGNTYHHLSMPECWFQTEPEGSPEIMYKVIQLILPPNESVQNISITGSAGQEMPGEYDIYPKQPPRKTSEPAPVFVQHITKKPTLIKQDNRYA